MQTRSLSQAGVVAIDFTSHPPAVVRADGSRQALTAQALSADVLGVAYTQVDGGLMEEREQGETVLHAVNTHAFDGQAEHTHGGDVDRDGQAAGQTSLVDAQDTRLYTTTAHTLQEQADSTVQPVTQLAAGDTRLHEGAAGTVQTGQQAGHTEAAPDTAVIRSDEGSGSVRGVNNNNSSNSNDNDNDNDDDDNHHGVIFVPAEADTPTAAQRRAQQSQASSATPALFAGGSPLLVVALGASAGAAEHTAPPEGLVAEDSTPMTTSTTATSSSAPPPSPTPTATPPPPPTSCSPARAWPCLMRP